jgi:hypothetical protein
MFEKYPSERIQFTIRPDDKIHADDLPIHQHFRAVTVTGQRHRHTSLASVLIHCYFLPPAKFHD